MGTSGRTEMFETLRKFFMFCDSRNRRRFHMSLALGVVEAFFIALKVPAIAIAISAMLSGEILDDSVIACVLVMAFSILASAFVNYFSTMAQTRGGYMTCAYKRIEIAKHMRYMPMGYFNENSLGRIASVATNTMESLENVATRVVMLVTKGMMTTLMVLLMVFFFDYRIGLVCMAGLVPFFLSNIAMRKAGKRISERKVASDTKLTERVLEYVHGIAEAKAYRMVGKMAKRLDSTIDENVVINTLMEEAFIPWMALESFFADMISVLISIFALYLHLIGDMPMLQTVMMLICSFLIPDGLKSAGSYSALLRVVDISVDKANAILETPSMDISGRDITPKECTLSAECISFAYSGKRVIDGVSLTVPEGTTAAFVGPSGGGKTTLANLLSRFWDVDRGKVMLGGIDVRYYDMDSLMRNFSFVFQRVTLFDDTVLNNIRFGKPDATKEEVIAIAKKAKCHDFIMALPNGYETMLGENGGTLSGGERQRISIARAMMKDSPIVILDEATANVDPENERDLIDALSELTRGKTVIMIAHRLKTVENADQIFVIDKGKIAQRGRHSELLKEEGIYKRFIMEREKAANWKLA